MKMQRRNAKNLSATAKGDGVMMIERLTHAIGRETKTDVADLILASKTRFPGVTYGCTGEPLTLLH